MRDLFDNANTHVTRKRYGTNVGRDNSKKDLIPVKDRKHKNVDSSKEYLAESTKFTDLNKQVDSRRLEDLKHTRMFDKALAEGYITLKESLVKDVFRQICLEALVVDSEPVLENLNTIISLVDSQVDSVGGFEGIKKIASDTQNPVLESIVTICEEAAKCSSDRNLKEAKGGKCEELNFELTDEEAKDFDYKKQEIGVDSISDFVKTKVLDVVKTEQKYNQDKADVMTSIEDQLKELDAPVEEAMSAIFKPDGIEEISLFEALMTESYKVIIESSSAAIFESKCAKESDECDDDDDCYDLNDLDIEDDEDDVIEDDDEDDDDEDEEMGDLLEEGMVADKLEKLNRASAKLWYSRLIKMYKSSSSLEKVIKSNRVHVQDLKDILNSRDEEKMVKKAKRIAGQLAVCAITPEMAVIIWQMMPSQSPKWAIKQFIHFADEFEKIANKRLVELKRIESEVAEGYEPIMNVFVNNGANVLESLETDDVEGLVEAVEKMAKEMKDVAEGCKTRKEAAKCKESIREVQKSTEEVQEAGCKKKMIEAGCKEEELLICPICEMDPCECSESMVNESSLKAIVQKFKDHNAKIKTRKNENDVKSAQNHITQVKTDLNSRLRNTKTVDDHVLLIKATTIAIDDLKTQLDSLDSGEYKKVVSEYNSWLLEYRTKVRHQLKTNFNAVYISDDKEMVTESFCKYDTVEEAANGGFKKKVEDFFNNNLAKSLSKKDFGVNRKNLVGMINRAKTNDDLSYIELELKSDELYRQLNMTKVKYPKSAEKIDEHIKWIKNEAPKIIEARRKELAKKEVVESFSCNLDVLCENLNNMIEKHEHALYEAKSSMDVEYDGRVINAPFIQSVDCKLSNLEFAYKVKVTCESLKNMAAFIESKVDSEQLQEMININIASVSEALDLLESVDNMSYKKKTLKSAKGYLNQLNTKISCVTESVYVDEVEENVITEAVRIVKDIYSDLKQDSILESINNDHMEVVMAEAITKYTILEAFNTLKLLNMNEDDVRRVTRKIGR